VTAMSQPSKSWRDVIKVHPAADLFPMMSEAELRKLGEDIVANGLREPVTLAQSEVIGENLVLLDGRNRLDAMELAGLQIVTAAGVLDDWLYTVPAEPRDPYAYVFSANILRRHLTAEQKREAIAKLVKAQPEKSDRAIAREVKVDHKTVAAVRSDAEARGEIPHVEKRTDTKGRQQPAHKSEPATIATEPDPIDEIPIRKSRAARGMDLREAWDAVDIKQRLDFLQSVIVFLRPKRFAEFAEWFDRYRADIRNPAA